MSPFIRVCTAAAALVASQVQAAPVTMQLLYEGVSNSATATALVTIDSGIFGGANLTNVSSAAATVSAFSVTVSGASAGNGTFGLSDVNNWIVNISAPLDLNLDLVGQTGFNDFNWCGLGFIGCTAPAPGGTAVFTIRANAETGDIMTLRSMTVFTTVPEPASIALVGLALVGAAAASRGKRRQA